MMKKSKAKKNGTYVKKSRGGSGSRPWPSTGFAGRFASKLPFMRNRQGAWEDLDNPKVANLPPSDYKNISMASSQRLNELDASNNVYQQQPMGQMGGLQGQMQLPSMDLARSNSFNDQFFNNMATTNDQRGPAYAHQAAPSFSSTDAYQFGGTLQTNIASSGTLRSQMDGTLYSQPGPARQHPDSYSQARRQLNRASELSSLSSGFGDGDFTLPNDMIKPPPPATSNLRQSTNLVGRLSFLSQSRRDTVYTQASEDSPPRFRSVNSWVNQQSGRIKRARQREQDNQNAPPVPTLPGQPGVPGIHNPPVEQSFNMMMQDDEVPRPVEDTMAMR